MGNMVNSKSSEDLERGQDAVELNGVTKTYGSTRALDGLTVALPRGEMVAFLGPNGAGKTTAISTMLGFVRPDQGAASLFGRAPGDAVRRGMVGAMFQGGGLMPGVRVGELLRMMAGLFPRPLPYARVIELAQLDGLESHPIRQLSGGELQRVRFGVSIIGDPELLLLDEPTAAMDVEARRKFWIAMTEEVKEGRTVIFSTHYLEEADLYADRVLVIGSGRLLADGSPASIKANLGRKVVRFTSPGVDEGSLTSIPGVDGVQVFRGQIELQTINAEATLRTILASEIEIADLEITVMGLEAAFVALTESAQVPSMEAVK
jgi:ABC-2 type transport system ATP-binding protein